MKKECILARHTWSVSLAVHSCSIAWAVNSCSIALAVDSCSIAWAVLSARLFSGLGFRELADERTYTTPDKLAFKR